MHEIVEELQELIRVNRWEDDFNQAIRSAQACDVYDFPELQAWTGYEDYLHWVNRLVTWAPRERGDSLLVYEHIVRFYFILDQPTVMQHQTPITQGGLRVQQGDRGQELSELSRWIVRFSTAWGSYLDTLDSAKEVKTFQDDAAFNWNEYMPPPASYLSDDPAEAWKAYRTFNQFFARHVKPGMRLIAGLCDDGVLVSPADSTFVGWWQISQDSKITVQEKLHVKGLQWSIEELLEGSEYKDRFKGGIFTHSFLDTYDYHRWHTPVRGKVLEARVIQGQAYLDVKTKPVILDDGDCEKKPRTARALNALDATGYQFVQTRGLVVIDSPIGLVACLPMGMAQVSSVVITAEPGVSLHKGEELGYFQFGGSDFVMVFERASNVRLITQPNVHYQQGTWIGNAFPYGM